MKPSIATPRQRRIDPNVAPPAISMALPVLEAPVLAEGAAATATESGVLSEGIVARAEGPALVGLGVRTEGAMWQKRSASSDQPSEMGPPMVSLHR
jgi:hypothetical protein